MYRSFAILILNREKFSPKLSEQKGTGECDGALFLKFDNCFGEKFYFLSLVDAYYAVIFFGYKVNVGSTMRRVLGQANGEAGPFVFGYRVAIDPIEGGLHGPCWNTKRLEVVGPKPQCDNDGDEEYFCVLC